MRFSPDGIQRMMGIHQPQPSLSGYQVNLDKRVRADHPLCRVTQVVAFSFVRSEVAHGYGDNGNESVDPVILLKMMFPFFYDNVPSARERMNIIPERLDYLWFLGYGLDDEIPNHRVAAQRDRRRRQHWAEGSFADAANHHGFKRARWRRRLHRAELRQCRIAK